MLHFPSNNQFRGEKKEKRNKKKKKKKENTPIEGLRAREEQFALIHRNSIGQSFERKCIVNNWTDSKLLAETKWPTLFDKRKVLLESRTSSGHLRWNEGRGNWRDSFRGILLSRFVNFGETNEDRIIWISYYLIIRGTLDINFASIYLKYLKNVKIKDSSLI